MWAYKYGMVRLKDMPGYALWYLLKPDHVLHGRIRQLGETLGGTTLPAHIPLLTNLTLFSTAVQLFNAYNRKARPTFTISSRPTVISIPGQRHLMFQVTSENPYSLWHLPITSREHMYYHSETKHINLEVGTIHPDDYDLVLMDTRYLDTKLWCPVSTSQRSQARDNGIE